MIEVGRVCIKTAGRENGLPCVVVKKEDENFVLVTGPKSLTKVRRRRCNIEHLKPLEHKITIKSNASDSDVEEAMKKDKILQKIEPAEDEKEKKARSEKEKPTKQASKNNEKKPAEKKDSKVESKHVKTEKKDTK